MPEQVNGYRKSGFMKGSIVVYHQPQFQLITALFHQRRADEAAAVFTHEIDDLGGGITGGGYKIAFVLPVFIVYNYYQLAELQVFYSTFNTVQHGGLKFMQK